MRVPLGAIAMYPDETCFDPNRPSLLPYWLDDLTESACKTNLIFSGNTTGNTAQAGQPGADPATIAAAQAECAHNNGQWDATLNVCRPSFITQWGPYLAGAAALTAILAFLFKK